MFLAIVRFWYRGLIGSLYVEPRFHFHYFGLEWVNPLPARGMYAIFAIGALTALGMGFGRYQRAAAAVFCGCFTYAELCEKSGYLNHYYFVSLVALLLACLPNAKQVPRAALFVLRGQIALVYFFAGLAKLDADWLLHAQPFRLWLSARADAPLIGGLLSEPASAYLIAWCGALFDLSAPFLLLWSRTRIYAYAAVVTFHVFTAVLFPTIGMFPWLMIAATTIFFAPDWPRIGLASRATAAPPRCELSARMLAFFFLHFAIQAALPLRFVLYPGSPSWTDQGFRFAWRVMIADKIGSVRFDVVERGSQRRWSVEPRAYLTPFQERMMGQSPDMILELAHEVERDFRTRTGGDVSVFADAWASLNGRPSQRLIDPGVDLALERDSLRPATWILPLRGKP